MGVRVQTLDHHAGARKGALLAPRTQGRRHAAVSPRRRAQGCRHGCLCGGGHRRRPLRSPRRLGRGADRRHPRRGHCEPPVLVAALRPPRRLFPPPLRPRHAIREADRLRHRRRSQRSCHARVARGRIPPRPATAQRRREEGVAARARLAALRAGRAGRAGALHAARRRRQPAAEEGEGGRGARRLQGWDARGGRCADAGRGPAPGARRMPRVNQSIN
mmetsp:Transcript_23079/g.75402  ORF Transcript_23079/g.75402 Transcript_23079/m.75402 type:complete len:218 (+) Transcript_23079:515-1168(+)